MQNRISDGRTNHRRGVAFGAARIHVIDVAAATVAKDRDNSGTQRLLQSAFDKEWIVGAPLHPADRVQMKSKVAEHSHGLLAFIANHHESDLWIDRPGGFHKIRMIGGHPGFHAAITSHRAAIERNGFILSP